MTDGRNSVHISDDSRTNSNTDEQYSMKNFNSQKKISNISVLILNSCPF